MQTVNGEIGSEFWDVPLSDVSNILFPENTTWFLSGRAALNAIISDIRKKINFCQVALPSWCCDSMILPFVQQGIKVKFYSVYFKDGILSQEFSKIPDCDAVLVMDYFGYSRSPDFDFDCVVIRDVTHSVFCNGMKKADYTFGSLRKWAGFFTGGFAYEKNGAIIKSEHSETDNDYVLLRSLAMEKKTKYINGETLSKSYLTDFEEAENYLEKNFMGAASERDIECAKKIDIDFIRYRRRENAAFLLSEFSSLAVFPELKDNDCPLFVPLFIDGKQRDELRKYLIEKKIYCPVHWPRTNWHEIKDEAVNLYDREISIVCDQRYSVGDMERICFEINNFLSLR